MIRRPLSPALMSAAIAVHDQEPAARALLALALLDDRHLTVIEHLPLRADAAALRDLLLDEEQRAVARCASLATAAALWPFTRSPEALDLAAAVDATTVAELASVTPWEGLVSMVRPPRRPRKPRLAKWERDLAVATSTRISA